MSGYGQEFTKGIWKENPVFRMVLGLCPLLAVTNTAINGIAMGLASTFVLVCSNTVVASLRSIIPDKVRIPSFIIVIASFVTIVDLTMNAWAHQMHKTLGLFIPLIVVNCLILGILTFSVELLLSLLIALESLRGFNAPFKLLSYFCFNIL